MSPRFFTLAEANAELPWLIQQLKEINDLLGKLDQLKSSSESIVKKAGSNGHSHATPEPDRLQTDVGRASRKVKSLLQGIAARGIILRDPSTGLSDFPSKGAQGQEIYLCWKSGEERIAFWHAPETGFAGRQPL